MRTFEGEPLPPIIPKSGPGPSPPRRNVPQIPEVIVRGSFTDASGANPTLPKELWEKLRQYGSAALAFVMPEGAAPPPRRPRPKLKLVVNNPVPPAAQPIPEIRVTAARPSSIPALGSAARLAGRFAFVGALGVTAADLLRMVSQNRLDEAWQNLRLTEGAPRRRDTPVQTIVPETIPEIIVTAPRPFPASPILPNPFIFPDPGFISPVRVPRTAPQVRPSPQIEIPAPPLPTIRPTRAPAQSPSPLVSPVTNPLTWVSPGRLPSIRPRPRFRPRPRTQTRAQSRPQLRGNLQTLYENLAQPSPAAQQARKKCPPCKKDKKKDERREECFKKMVEERAYERWDKVYKWQEIDCVTGRPLE